MKSFSQSLPLELECVPVPDEMAKTSENHKGISLIFRKKHGNPFIIGSTEHPEKFSVGMFS